MNMKLHSQRYLEKLLFNDKRGPNSEVQGYLNNLYKNKVSLEEVDVLIEEIKLQQKPVNVLKNTISISTLISSVYMTMLVLSTDANTSVLSNKASHYKSIEGFKKFWTSSYSKKALTRINNNIQLLINLLVALTVIIIIAVVIQLVTNELDSKKYELIALYTYKRELLYKSHLQEE